MSTKKEIVKSEDKNIEKDKKLRSAIPVVDIYENADELRLYAEMPGVKKEDVSVNIDNGILSVSGVRHFDEKGVSGWCEFSGVEYKRSFSVPQTIDIKKVKAELNDGVLKLHLPKSESAKPRMIEVKAA